MAKKSFEETYQESVNRGKKYSPSEQLRSSGKSSYPESELERDVPKIARELKSDTSAAYRERMAQQKPKISDADLTKNMQESIDRGKPKIVEDFKAGIKSKSGAGRLGRAAGAAGVALLAYDAAKNVIGDSGEKAYKERTAELASSKQREKTKAAAREAKAEAETQDVKRPYMAPAKVEKPVARKRAESASYNPPPSSVREDYLKQEDSSPVSDAGYITYESSSDDIHPESSSMKYADKSSEQTPFSGRPIDEAATSLNRMGKYAKGGGIGRGTGKALRGGGCVMKRAGGGKVMSRGVAKRGFGKEVR